MADEHRKVRWVKVTAEIFVEIHDEMALEQAVLADIDAARFEPTGGQTVEQPRREEREQVLGDPAGALCWLADNLAFVPDVPGVEIHEAMSNVAEVGPDGRELRERPDFGALSGLAGVARTCGECIGFQLTRRRRRCYGRSGRFSPIRAMTMSRNTATNQLRAPPSGCCSTTILA
jgi:hypothetical protein